MTKKSNIEMFYMIAKKLNSDEFIVLNMRTVTFGTLKLLLENAYGEEKQFIYWDCIKIENIKKVIDIMNINYDISFSNNILNNLYNISINKELGDKMLNDSSNLIVNKYIKENI